MLSKKLLLRFAKDYGFHDSRIISNTRILHIFNNFNGMYRFDISRIKTRFQTYFRKALFSENSLTLLKSTLSRQQLGLNRMLSTGSSYTFLICGLSCYRNEQERYPGNDPVVETAVGTLAPFARRNYYAEAVQRLKAVFKKIQSKTGIEKTGGRIFCNSGVPEKFLAWASGLGTYGKNGLIINKLLGSYFIIAGLLLSFSLPDPMEEDIPGPPGELCGDCSACYDACPTHAIKGPGIIDLSLCIQALSTRLIIFPEYIKKAFGNRIYGCQVCQEVCPFNKHLSLETETERGELGPWIPLKTILDKSHDDLKKYLKKTVPGSSWIDMRSLQRNGLIAAGNLACNESGRMKCGSLLNLIKPYLKNHHPALIDAAKWAIEIIQKNI